MIKILVCLDNIDIIQSLFKKEMAISNRLHFIYGGIDLYANEILLGNDEVIFTTNTNEIVCRIKCGIDDSPFKDQLFLMFSHGVIYIEKVPCIFKTKELAFA